MSAPVLLRPAPQVVLHGEGSVAGLLDLLVADGATRPAFLHGTRSLAAAASALPVLPGTPLDLPFAGECSPTQVSRFGEAAAAHGADAVIGLGGGKALDTAKALGARAGLPVYLVPTLASTCAGWSPLSVFYDDDSRHLGFEVWRVPTRAVALEPELIVSGPVAYVISGIADTLAKWVETRAAFAAAPASLLTDLGRAQAEACRDVVLDAAAPAVAALRAGRTSPDAVRIAEAAIATAGLVGGVGGVHGSATAAHPVSDALSEIPASRDLLHGVKVAYGILVQLALEERWDDVDLLAPLYAELGLPRRLGDVGAADAAAAREIIVGTALHAGTTFHHLGPLADPALLAAAVDALEARHRHLDAVAVTGRDRDPLPA